MKFTGSVAETCSLIDACEIPPSTIASLAHVAQSKVSEYRRGLDVSARASAKIVQAVQDIADLVFVMEEHFGLRPDLRHLHSLKAAITELKAARASVAAQQQLEQAEQEVGAALQELANIK